MFIFSYRIFVRPGTEKFFVQGLKDIDKGSTIVNGKLDFEFLVKTTVPEHILQGFTMVDRLEHLKDPNNLRK